MHIYCYKLVSFYAFFKGWLLPSLPPNNQNNYTNFYTQTSLRTLSLRSGLFPSRQQIFSPIVCLFLLNKFIILSLKINKVFTLQIRILKKSSFTNNHLIKTLYLHRFRRKPDITKFEQPFTPYHKSSPFYATNVSSVLQFTFVKLQLAHGKIT